MTIRNKRLVPECAPLTPSLIPEAQITAPDGHTNNERRLLIRRLRDERRRHAVVEKHFEKIVTILERQCDDLRGLYMASLKLQVTPKEN